MLVAVPVALGDDLGDLVVGHDRRGVVDEGDLVTDVGVGVGPEEVGQLHDVAVGVVVRTVGGCVDHVLSLLSW